MVTKSRFIISSKGITTPNPHGSRVRKFRPTARRQKEVDTPLPAYVYWLELPRSVRATAYFDAFSMHLALCTEYYLEAATLTYPRRLGHPQVLILVG